MCPSSPHKKQLKYHGNLGEFKSLLLVDLSYHSKRYSMRNRSYGKQAAGQSRTPGRVMWTKYLPRDTVQPMEAA